MVNHEIGDCLVEAHGDGLVHWRSSYSGEPPLAGRAAYRAPEWFPDCQARGMMVLEQHRGWRQVTCLMCLAARSRP